MRPPLDRLGISFWFLFVLRITPTPPDEAAQPLDKKPYNNGPRASCSSRLTHIH